jgi:hypothetical protein
MKRAASPEPKRRRLRPLRAQCTRGQGGRTVQLHPQEALLQQARELQASPAFDEIRQRRQVVEHRIARLVQLGIRQARYIGRTKTLFQLRLAAAVANLTLLAATSGALSESGSDGFSWSLVILAALVPRWRTGQRREIWSEDRAKHRLFF